MVLLLVIIFLLLFYVHFRVRRRRMEALAAKISGPPAWPLVGNALQFLGTTQGKQRWYMSSFIRFILFSVVLIVSFSVQMFCAP
jgi:hypothetical protein